MPTEGRWREAARDAEFHAPFVRQFRRRQVERWNVMSHDPWSLFAPPAERVWVSSVGVEYRVWQDPMPPHVRPMITFMDVMNPAFVVVVRPQFGTVLSELGDDQLQELLEAAVGHQDGSKERGS